MATIILNLRAVFCNEYYSYASAVQHGTLRKPYFNVNYILIDALSDPLLTDIQKQNIIWKLNSSI